MYLTQATRFGSLIVSIYIYLVKEDDINHENGKSLKKMGGLERFKFSIGGRHRGLSLVSPTRQYQPRMIRTLYGWVIMIF